MGPPLRKLSIKKLELSPLGLVGASPGDALNVAVTVAVGEVATPGDAGTAGPAGDVAAVGNCVGCVGTAGFARAPGLTAGGGGAPGGDVRGGAGGGDCANEVRVSTRENRQAVSNVFIVEAGVEGSARFEMSFQLSQTVYLRVEQNFSPFFKSTLRFSKVASLIRNISIARM